MQIIKTIVRRSLYAALLMAGSMCYLHAQTPAAREYQVKAVFLFNFAQFVEWPATAFSTTQSPLVIGIIGGDPFGAWLKETVADEKVDGRPVLVQHYNNIDEIAACHILFINLAETNKREQVIAGLKGRSIFTVSDTPDFLQEGGMVRLYTRNKKIQFQINVEASKAAGLVISSKLLRLAEIFVSNKK